MYNEHDYRNILSLISFAFANGVVKSQDDAKVMLSLEAKTKLLLEQPEEEDGNDVPASD